MQDVPRVPVSRPVDGANAYYVPGETQRIHGSALSLTASDRRHRGELYREAKALVKANEEPRKRRRRRKAEVDRSTPEPGRGKSQGKLETRLPRRKTN